MWGPLNRWLTWLRRSQFIQWTHWCSIIGIRPRGYISPISRIFEPIFNYLKFGFLLQILKTFNNFFFNLFKFLSFGRLAVVDLRGHTQILLYRLYLTFRCPSRLWTFSLQIYHSFGRWCNHWYRVVIELPVWLNGFLLSWKKRQSLILLNIFRVISH